MINPFLEVNWHPGQTALRRFGVTLWLGLAVVESVLLVLAHGYGAVTAVAQTVTMTGLLLLPVGLTFPRLLLPFYYPWFILGCIAGLIISNVLLALFFYSFFTVYALVLRLTGKTAEFLRPGWREHHDVTSPERYFRQY